MAYEIEIYKHKKGYGYKILKDGIPFIVQDFKPDVEGFQPMTEEEAKEYAEKLKNYYENLEKEG